MSVFTSDTVVDNVVQVDGGNPNAVKVDGSAVTQPISGAVSVSNFPATQPVSGTVSISGVVQTTSANSNTSTITQVILSTNTNAQLLAANANRKRAIIFVPKNTAYIKTGVTASATSFTYQVTAMNTIIEITGRTGEIDCLSTTGQTVTVTEWV